MIARDPSVFRPTGSRRSWVRITPILALLATALVGVRAIAQPLVIDDFEAGPFSIADSSLTPPLITTGEQTGIDPSHVLGGVRLVSVQATGAGAATAAFAPVMEANDEGALLTAASGGRVLFQYDAVPAPVLIAAGSGGALGLDLSDYARIVIRAAGVTGSGATARVLFWGAAGSVAGTPVPIVEGESSLPLSGFSAAELEDVRQIDIEIDGITPTSSLRVMEVSAAEGTVRHVGSGTCGGQSPCYAAIQAAVDAAEPGDIVRVQAGTYPELVRITAKSDLTLEGDPASPSGSAVIAPSDGGLAECLGGTAAVEVASSSRVTLRHLAISGYDGTGLRLRGATLANSEVQIVGLRITGTGSADCGAGILVEEPNAETLLAHNAIVGNAHDGVAFRGTPPFGTSVPQHLWSNTIVGNGRHGVVVSGFERPSLWNNLIVGNGAQTSSALPAYGVARELAGLLAPLANSQITLRHNLVCGNRSGELSLAPTETLDSDSDGNLSPTGSEGAAFTASADCGDPETLFAVGAGPDTLWGTDDDDYFLAPSSPAVEAGDGLPTPAIAEAAVLQSDFRRAGVRPADGDDDGVFDFDIGALEYGAAPTISITTPADGSTATSSQIVVTGSFTGTAPRQILLNGGAPTLSGLGFASAQMLGEGANTFTATITNAFGSASDAVTVTLPPLEVEIESPVDGAVTNASLVTVSGTVNDSAASVSVNGVAATVSNHSWTASGVPLQLLTNVLTATASRSTASATDESIVVRSDTAPPDPAPSSSDEASELDPSESSTLKDAVSFLYTGTNPIQSIPNTSVIDAERVAVVRGKIAKRSGAPLGGVTVTVLGRPEFGSTRSQDDGSYDLVVNGGGGLTLDYRLPGYIPAQRQVNPRWRDYAIVDDLVMIPLDRAATAIAVGTSSPAQVARGSVSTDADGARRATAFFRPGTRAWKKMGNGDLVELAEITLRFTEFTVGANGPQTMPGSLPPTSSYTYAVELSADEVVHDPDAVGVKFSQAVVFYLENFIDMPKGTIVPAGTYDYDRATWLREKNGRVIQIDSIDGSGRAVVSGMTLSDADERIALAGLYAPGQQLWRIEMDHFSAPDWNWMRWFPTGAGDPRGKVNPHTPGPNQSCPIPGSVIECETQVPGERIDLAQVPFSLHYRSNRTRGYASGRTVEIPITDDSPPAPLKRVDVQVDVAGKRSEFSFPNSPDQPDFLFTWDGTDAYGREVNGASPGTVRIGYVYDAKYGEPPNSSEYSFAEPSLTRAEIAFARSEAIAWRDHSVTFASLDARGFGIGGWTLDPHHFYDRVSGTLYRGDGRSQKLSAVAEVIRELTGQNTTYGATTGVPGPASGVLFGGSIAGVAMGPDGSFYLVEYNDAYYSGDRVYKIDPTGYVTGVTAQAPPGGQTGFTPVDVPASAAAISRNRITDIAVGGDGSIYLAEYVGWLGGQAPYNSRILRINPTNGMMELFAGGGWSASDPCDSAAAPMLREGTAALYSPLCLYTTSELDTGPDGGVYFSRPNPTNVPSTIRRVKPDGTLQTVVMMKTGNPWGMEGALAQKLPPNGVDRFTVDDEGRVYFSRPESSGGTFLGQAIYRVRPDDSVVERVAGAANPPSADNIGDGLPALQARFHATYDLEAGPDGRIYVVDQMPFASGRIVRSFDPGGVVRRVAGDGTVGTSGDGGAAIQAPLASSVHLAVAPDGVVYLGEVGLPYPDYVHQVRKVSPSVPRGAGEITIASQDGTELYDFDAAGRHLRTRSMRTGAKLRTFCYAGGHLTKIRQVAPTSTDIHELTRLTDCDVRADDAVTTVEWGGSSPAAIVGPYGARTELSVDANGYLSSVSDPLDHVYTLESTASGLLTSFTPPEGGKHVFTYDSLGLLTRDDDPEGGSKELTRTDSGDRVEIDIETAMGRVQTKAIEPMGSGVTARTFTDPAGLETVLFENPGDSTSSRTPDGTEREVIYGPDPRLGTVAPIAKEERITVPATPANLIRVNTHERTASVDAQGNLTSQTDRIALNGRTSTVAYQKTTNGGITTRKETTTSPLTRKVERYFDAQERVSQTQLIGLEAVRFVYDARGRLSSASQGQGAAERTTSFGYGADGYLASVTDDLSRTTSFEYDDAGRLERTVLPDSREIIYSWDDNGNLASLTPPGQPAHVFRYTSLDQESEYEPPAVDANERRTFFTYDLDRDLTRIDRPDGGAVVLGYDSAGRVSSVQTSRGTTQPTYHTTTGNVTSLSAPAGEGLAFTYDGFLPKRTTWSGTVAGYVEHGYDRDFRVSTQNVNGSQSVSFGYDNDSLLTSAGSETLTRHAQTGLVTGTTLGTVATSLGYNGFGEQTSESATVGGSPVYATTFTRDDLGRVAQKVETIQGTTTTIDYRYDPAGRLDQVKQNGSVIRTYAYDGNGNRLSVVEGAVTTIGTYDDQDRLTSYGANTYTQNLAGDLTSTIGVSGITQYSYDELGNLWQVTLPNSTTIAYSIDGQNRRIGKRVNGTLVKGWLYQDQLEPVAELDGSGNVVSRFVYGSKANVPDYMVQGGNTYRILSDHLGSVRLVVNTTTGAIAQRIDYDEFGNITADTNPGFQPFGFAGGLYDADTGLTRFGARDYDAQTGRWTTKDPVRFGGGLNLYGYVMSDPVNLVDPSGLTTIQVNFQAPSTDRSVVLGQPAITRQGATFSQSGKQVVITDPNANVTATFPATSGPHGNDVLPVGPYSTSGPVVDLPNTNANAPYCDPSGNCWWQPIEPQFSTDRTGLGFHPDGNVPGTEGCIGATQKNTSGARSALRSLPTGSTVLVIP